MFPLPEHEVVIVFVALGRGRYLSDCPLEAWIVDAITRALPSGIASAVNAALCAPAYVAPERRNGGAPTGPRDDIFAVGVLLHEMLTGQPPTIQAESLEEVRSLPPWLAELARRCLTPEPAERWPDAAAALEQVSRPNSETV